MTRYILLTGAMSNVGDHLIVDRAKKLLTRHIPQVELVELPRWKPLDNDLDEVNSADALVLCGGPAYQLHFYPGIYPLVDDLHKIKPPIVPLGLGWKGYPGDEQSLAEYKFTPSSVELLKLIHARLSVTSCRDYLTKRVLARHGFRNVVMTGDPAWYDLDSIGKPFAPPSDVRSVVLSAPAGKTYHQQFVELATLVQSLLPTATITCTFHHGWSPNEYVPKEKARALRELRESLLAQGFQTMSLAANLPQMEELYSHADLHIGYRLHAHLMFLSHRRPSFLLEEDGRGRGASEAIGLRGIPAWRRSNWGTAIAHLPRNRFVRGLSKRVLGDGIEPRSLSLGETEAFLSEEMENGFSRFRGLQEVLDSHYARMSNFLAEVLGV